ncbi:MAG: 2-C-methyl-D-erythritol 4-phosphate cytidylyltransferase [Clostridia bacterium]|nr:2-C-methyl-D-erythritol 4-phosphate cytidylyltransferase [Clostridia bacterium]MBO7397887.1 2-C-methyl-D-erythritol 4-phosphate cytidylyltransferase [Clostridia bacterium]MBO7504576.1 2-C-methyl-D-erythritol 4-phosphate cytidylyltransferase [Clostridia bacterium]MBO7658625.1 2-C-methyl-D-erythritol 4-phosphate cytidylyltransferase [Clostridia bacterium]MBP5765529.1 2-C-methyl-D-erythritol 4-phosphate cytidylyltransferase [Clostridia bacterium]
MNFAICLAGGTGSRMGAKKPKQFLTAGGKPIIVHTLSVFEECAQIDGIVVVCVPDWCEYCRKLLEKYGFTKVISVVPGGETRAESSAAGVAEVEAFLEVRGVTGEKRKRHTVLIHDAARPFITGKIVRDNIKAAKKEGACETVIPVTDTVVAGTDGFADKIVPRQGLFRAQTPQSFRLDVISDAFAKYDPERDGQVTDDAEIVLRAGGKVVFVEGSVKNVKITSPEDLDFF